MNNTKHPVNYIFTILIAVFFVLFINIIFNWIIDPFEYFQSNETQNNFNPIIISRLDRNTQLLWLKLQTQKAIRSKNNLLFGASNVVRGFDICKQKNLQKLALSGLRLKETTEILSNVLNDVQGSKTFFLLLIGESEEVYIQKNKYNNSLHRYLLDVRTTIFSFYKLYFLLSKNEDNQANSSNCNAVETDTTSRDGLTHEKIKSAVNSFKTQNNNVFKEELISSLEAFIPNCRINKHKIVYYTLPAYITSDLLKEIFPKLEERSRIIKTTLAEYNKKLNSCEIQFHDLALSYYQQSEMNLFNNKNEWIDVTHFKSNLGKIFLKNLLYEINP